MIRDRFNVYLDGHVIEFAYSEQRGAWNFYLDFWTTGDDNIYARIGGALEILNQTPFGYSDMSPKEFVAGLLGVQNE